MAGERNPGPLSQMERPIEIGDNTLPRTEMPRPGPVGLDAGPAKGAPKATAVKELNIAGEFPWQPSITDAEEIAELSANRWMPGTDDFVAVPAGTVPVAPTFGNALGAILEAADGTLGRVNVFTHANKGMVAYGGTIQKQTVTRAQVMINVNSPGDNLTAMDQTSMTNLSAPGVTFTAPQPIRGKTTFTVDDVRKKFAPDALFVLYACHSGQDSAFLKSIAKFFQVKVTGFSDEIVYFPPPQTNPKKFQRAGEKIGLGVGGTPAADWRNLITDPKAITATP